MNLDYIKSIRDLINNSISEFTDRPALSFVNHGMYTYKELGDKISRVSYFLSQHDIKKGDKVAIFAENSPNWGVTYLAITSMGAVVVPILPDFSKKEADTIINHSEAKTVFVSQKLYRNISKDIVNSDKHIILLRDFNIIPNDTTVDNLESNLDYTIDSYIEENNVKYSDSTYEDISEDDLASIIYTSGTTGTSKGVMLTHKNIISNVHASFKVHFIDTYDRLISVLPLSHTYENTIGFLFPIMRGACVYYIGQAPTANVLLPALKKIKPTMMLSVPLIIEKIYRMKIYKTFTGNAVVKALYSFSPTRKILNRIAGKKLMETFGGELRFFGIGGAPLAPDVETFLKEGKFPYSIGYGLTETSPLLAGASPKNTKYRSTGPAVNQVELRIDNPDNNGEGEIQAKGPNIMQGYYKNPEMTKQVFTNDGWFKTGDLGHINKDNFLYIRGRLKNIILGAGGENVYPEEIEASLNKYRYVVDSLVFEQEGKIVAKVHLNLEELGEQLHHIQKSALNLQKHALEELEIIKNSINSELNKFSRLNLIMIQSEPFEKTPTQKIKRYLYTNQK